jgi:hypothetical protein
VTKIVGQLALLPHPFSPKNLRMKIFKTAILFIIVENPNNYVFGYKIPPQSLRGKVFKL